MNPTEKLLSLSDRELLQAFLSLCGDVKSTQEEVLKDILHLAADTEWGRARGFGDIRSVAEYRKRQPITEWKDYVPVTQRMQAGEEDLLFPGRAQHFILTSATEGSTKLLPESERGFRAKKATGRLRLLSILRNFPELAREGAILPLSNCPDLGTTPGGIPIAMASGNTLENVPEAVMERLAFPLGILKTADNAALDYLLMRFALEKDVRVVVGNNAGRLAILLEMADRQREALIRDIAEGAIREDLNLAPEIRAALPLQANPDRAAALAAGLQASGCLHPRDFWPNWRLVTFWLSASVGRYMADLKPWLPESVGRMDCGYGASEAKLNVPLAAGRSAGPLTLHAQFVEFLPLEEGEPLLAHELQDGASYRLLLSTYSGLYRYDLRDIVRVEGFTGSCPNLVFESKAGDLGNLTGERLMGTLLLKVVNARLEDVGVRARHWCAYPDPDRHAYDLCVELAANSSELPDTFPIRLDEALKAASMPYSFYRDQGMLKPLRIRLMGQGWQDRLHKAKQKPGVSISQVKLPVVSKELLFPEMTMRLLEAPGLP